MKSFLYSAALLAGVLGTLPTSAQTARPAKSRAAARDTAVEGIYVAPNMTGAPKQKVTTDYDNQPISPATEEKATTLSAHPDAVKAKKIKTRRPPKRS